MRPLVSRKVSKALGSHLTFADVRMPHLSTRLIVRGNRAGAFELAVKDAGYDVEDERAYKVRRYRMGILEGSSELAGRIPHEANLDALQALCFTKGCYVGQELVARTEHRGTVRKRILPFDIIAGADATVSPGDNARTTSGGSKKLAKVLVVDDDYACGVGLVRLACLESVQGDGKVLGTTADGGAISIAGYPAWLNSYLSRD